MSRTAKSARTQRDEGLPEVVLAGEVRETRVACPACGGEVSRVLRVDDQANVPYFDPKTGVQHPNSIRRRRQCSDCCQVFITREGYGGNGKAH